MSKYRWGKYDFGYCVHRYRHCLFFIYDHVVGKSVALLCLLLGIGGLVTLNMDSEPTTEEYENAKKIMACKIVEENINNGFLAAKANKMKCGDVIKNIDVSDYEKAKEIAASSDK